MRARSSRAPFFLLLALLAAGIALAASRPVESVLLGSGGARIVYARPEVVYIESYGSDPYGGAFVSRRATLEVAQDGSVTGCVVGVYCYRGGLLGRLCIAAVNVTLYDSAGNVLAWNASATILTVGSYANVTVPFNGSVGIGEVYAVVVESLG